MSFVTKYRAEAYLRGKGMRVSSQFIEQLDGKVRELLEVAAKKYGIDPDSFPVSKDCDLHSLAIPLHNRMSPDDYKYVVNALKGI